jgi:hypothetical protein
MARKPNYNFERRERERIKAAKKAARLEAKRERSEKRKAEAAGLVPPGDETIALDGNETGDVIAETPAEPGAEEETAP